MSTSTSASAPVRPRYHHGDLRSTLLATVRELIAEQGIDGFRLREVSRRAGVSHTALYNHFADKSALVEALVVEAFDALTAAMRTAAAAAGDSLARLLCVGVAYVCFAHEHRTEFRFMFRPEHCPSETPSGNAEPLRVAAGAAYGVLVEAIGEALDAGLIAGDRDTLVLASWSTVHGLAALLVDGPERDANLDRARVESLAAAVTATLLAGMLARPAA